MSARWGWDSDMGIWNEPFFDTEISAEDADIFGFPEATRFIEVEGVLDDPGDEEQAIPRVVRCYDAVEGDLIAEMDASELNAKAFEALVEGLNT